MSAETPQMKMALREAEKRGTFSEHEWPRDENNVPMAKISCASSELVATQNYSNVTIGPISVTRFVSDDETLWDEVQRTIQFCEVACAQERESTHILMRSRVAQS